jgi:hypothetical protein
MGYAQGDNTFMRMFNVINLVAYKITGDYKFNSVNLFDTFRDSRPGYFKDWRKISEFSINVFTPIQLNILMELYPDRKQEYLAIYAKQLEQSLIGYDEEFGRHYYYTDVKWEVSQYYWRPLQLVWPALSHEELVSEPLAFGRYPHRIYWFDATSRVPMVYLMYLKNGGKRIPYVEAVVRNIMNRLDRLCSFALDG